MLSHQKFYIIISLFLCQSLSQSFYCPTPHTITFIETAKVTFSPNIAIISFNVLEKNNDPDKAWEQMEKISEKVKEKLELCGIEEGDISTDQLQLQLSYQSIYNETKKTYESIEDEYQAFNQMTVKVRKIDQIGNVLNSVISGGVKQINSISFTISDDKEKELKNQLIKQALQDAKDKANLAIEILNQKIISVVSVYFDEVNYQSVYQMESYAMRDEGNPFSAENQEKSLSVYVTIEIANIDQENKKI